MSTDSGTEDCTCPRDGLGHYADCGIAVAFFGAKVRPEPRPTIEDQPPPIPNDGPAIADLVIADMVERKRIGIERYGTPLQTRNGRDMLVDAYQEVLDLAMYVRGEIAERSDPIIWLLDKAKRWHQRGILNGDEYGAICALIFVQSAEDLTAEQSEQLTARGRALLAEHPEWEPQPGLDWVDGVKPDAATT